MRPTKKYLFAATLAAALSAHAAPPSTNETNVGDHLLKILKQKYPEGEFAAVRQTPIAGIYEVQAGKSVVYADAEGKYVLVGHLIELSTHRDLTSEREQVLNRVDFSQLPLDSAIVFKQGNGKRKLAVFSDPECPFCRRVEPELQKLTDTTIYLFLYPIAGLHPNAPAEAQSIWCAKDRTAAWRETMLEGKPPKPSTCANPIKTIAALGAKLNVTGTPTLISGDGRVLSGARPASAIQAWLDAVPSEGAARP